MEDGDSFPQSLMKHYVDVGDEKPTDVLDMFVRLYYVPPNT